MDKPIRMLFRITEIGLVGSDGRRKAVTLTAQYEPSIADVHPEFSAPEPFGYFRVYIEADETIPEHLALGEYLYLDASPFPPGDQVVGGPLQAQTPSG